MARYICPGCHEVVDSPSLRFAFCTACGAPVTTEDLVPIRPITAGRAHNDAAAAVPEVPS